MVLVWLWVCRVGNRLGTSEAEQQDLEFIRTKGEKGPGCWPSFKCLKGWLHHLFINGGGKKDVTGRIFHGKPTEQNHCELNRVLIQLNQRKAPSKIFKLATKQQHNNNSCEQIILGSLTIMWIVIHSSTFKDMLQLKKKI